MFDKSCSAYWCDDCGAEMRIDFLRSSEDALVLVCARPGCGFSRRFVKPGWACPDSNREPSNYEFAALAD